MTTNKMSRRRFIATTGSGVAGLAPARLAASMSGGQVEPPPPSSRKFYTVLSLGRLGLHGTFEQSVALAVKYGFEAVDPDPGLFARLPDDELGKLLNDMKAKNVRLGAAGLPVDFRRDEAAFSDDLKKLPEAAKTLERAGVRRVSTWVMPSRDR